MIIVSTKTMDNTNGCNNNNNNIIFIYVEYNTNSYHKNYHISNKFRQNSRRCVHCFDCKMAPEPFPFNNGNISSSADYKAAVKLKITYIDEVPRVNLKLASITAPNFDFVLKKLQRWIVFHFRS